MKKKFSFFLCISLIGFVALAQNPTPVMMAPSGSSFTPIEVGNTMVNIPIKVDQYDSMFFRITVSVDGASMALINPSGEVIISPKSPLVKFKSGPQSDDGNPTIFNMFKSGGQFTTENISTPVSGVWVLRLAFPPAKKKGFIQVNWSAKSSYESAISASDTNYLIGESGLFEYLVTNKQKPIAGLTPTIALTPVDAKTLKIVGGAVSQVGKESSDSHYSVTHIFTSAGKYQLSGSVVIPTTSGNISRTATTWIDVAKPIVSLKTSSVSNASVDSKGCSSGIIVGLTLNVSVSGDYIIRGDLKGSNGKTLSVGDSATLAAGTQTFNLLFPIGLIKEKIGMTASSYEVTKVHGHKMARTSETVKAFDFVHVGSSDGKLFCQ